MIKNKPKEFKLIDHTFNGIYRGVVEDNNDPLKTGRLKIRVFGLHSSNINKDESDGITTDDLPWAEPALSTLEGSISGFGLFCVPLQGSHVFLFFENGNYMRPIYFATVPGIPQTAPDTSEGFNDPDGVYPSTVGESDFHRTVRGTKQTVTSPSFAAQYPHNIVLSTHGGHVIEVDSTPGQERINVHHKSGSYIELNVNGDRTENIVQDETKTIGNDNTLSIGGDWTVTVTGDINITASGDITIEGTRIDLNP